MSKECGFKRNTSLSNAHQLAIVAIGCIALGSGVSPAAAVFAATLTTTTTSENVLVTVSVSEQMKLSKSVRAKLVIQNQRDEPIVMVESSVPVMTASLKDAVTGSECELTAIGKNTFGRRGVGDSLLIRRLEPGKQVSYEVDFPLYYFVEDSRYVWSANIAVNLIRGGLEEKHRFDLKPVTFEIIK